MSFLLMSAGCMAELLISFNVNSSGYAQGDLADIYRARFIWVDYYRVANQNQ